MASRRATLPVRAYDLSATLDSGQAFRWRHRNGAWHGVIGRYWVRLRADGNFIHAETAESVPDWEWLKDYLQVSLDLNSVLATFPSDEPLLKAVRACCGLRLLRQDLWECLASFILSSTKQIVQIRQIVAALCERFGDPVATLDGADPAHTFPSPAALACTTEARLRECKMGFRAPYLLAAARRISEGELDLHQLSRIPMVAAREELMTLPGVGRKIADCVLLFGCGFPAAFPVDVWVKKAIQRLYFPGRRVNPKRLLKFSETHFGPHAGYAQQYLFHYMRTKPAARLPETPGK
jgi:N-glycosylase/DNA lyase